MAHAHTSVNAASRLYLASERRYNYTTPKSFLEQISLYAKLLKAKAAELRGRVERLENGLAKLRSTATQVDELKEKLAVQEVELQQKNEAADALIAIVGVETEKVQTEKALGWYTSSSDNYGIELPIFSLPYFSNFFLLHK